MILRHVRATIARLFLLGLLLVFVAVMPLLISPDAIFRAYRARSLYDPPPRWYHYALPVLIVGVLGTGLGVGAWAAWLTFRPGWHPILERLAVYGRPGAVAAAIDAELADADAVTLGQPLKSFALAKYPCGEVIVTRSWMVQFSEFGLRLVHLPDVAWVRRVRLLDLTLGGSLPSHGLEVHVRRGRDETFYLAETDVRRLLVELIHRNPAALGRFDERFEQRWRDEREAVIADLDRERREIEGMAEEDAERERTERLEQAEAYTVTIETKKRRRATRGT
jgi:hypothetical protein